MARALMPVLLLSLALVACDQAEDETAGDDAPAGIEEEAVDARLEGLPLVDLDSDEYIIPDVTMPDTPDTGPGIKLVLAVPEEEVSSEIPDEMDALLAELPAELPTPLTTTTPATILAPTVTRVRALDKITARVTELDLPQDPEVRFGTLAIRARTCRSRPPEEPPETFAYLEIDDVKMNQDHEPVFAGWMMASSPALNALEHPVYDVWVIACSRSSADASSASE